MNKAFVAYFYFVGWGCISLGFHVSLDMPNIEVHLPFGFVRIGWLPRHDRPVINEDQVKWREFGWALKYPSAPIKRAA